MNGNNQYGYVKAIKLYDALVNKNLYSKSYREFIDQFSDKEKREKLHSGLKEKGLYSKSYDEFDEQFFAITKPIETPQLKKKESGEGFRTVAQKFEKPKEESKYIGDIKEVAEPFRMERPEVEKLEEEKKEVKQAQIKSIYDQLKPQLETTKIELQNKKDSLQSELNYAQNTLKELQMSGQLNPNDPEIKQLTLNSQNLPKQVQQTDIGLRNLKYTENFINDLDKILSGENQKFSEGVYQNVLKKLAFDGIASIQRNFDLKKISDKIEKGETITEDENLALASYGLLQEAQQNFPSGIGYEVGNGLVEMIPYLASFAISGGVSKGIQGSITKALKTTGEKSINNFVKKGLAYTTGQIIRPAFFSSLYSQAAEKQIGIVQPVETKEGIKTEIIPGTKEKTGKAWSKAYFNTLSEVMTEQLGEITNPVINKMIGKGVNQNINKNVISKIKNAVGFHSFISEMGEEFANEVLQTAIEGRPAGEIFDPRKILTTGLTIGIMGGGFAVSNIPYRNAITKEKVNYGKKIEAKLKKGIDNILEADYDVTQKAKDLEYIIDEQSKSGYTKSQMRDLIGYIQYKNADNTVDNVEYKLVSEPEIKPVGEEKTEKVSEVKSEEKVVTEAEKQAKTKEIKPTIDINKLNPEQQEQYKEMINRYGQKRADELITTFLPETEKYIYSPEEYQQKIKEETSYAKGNKSIQMRTESEKERTQQTVSDKNLPEFNRVELQNRPKTEKEKEIKPITVKSGINIFGIEIDDNKIVDFWKKRMTARGYLPKNVFDASIKKTGKVHKQLSIVHQTAQDYKRALKEAYGKTWLQTPKVTQNELEKINTALSSIGKSNQQETLKNIPEQLHEPLINMRNHIDALSREMVRSGLVEGELAAKFDENLGYYLTRTYRKHTDPKWKWENIDDEIKNRAISFMREEFPNYNEEKIDGILKELVYKKNDSILSAINKGKLGSKDLGILKKRKDIPVQIRELLGEYKDPLYNYSTSVSKMANLIENQKFLDEVKKDGINNYLFEEPKGEYHVKIAAEGTQTMSPLNGLYTTPEIAQSFEEFNRNEPISKLLRAYVKYLNVPVKYGKTILSPVTHARNYYANYMFHVANGRNIFSKEAVKGHQTIINDLRGKKDKDFRDYYNRLVELNVIGESTRGGEIHDAIKESVRYIEDFDKHGDDLYKKITKKGLRVAEKLYQVEDDVHKIIAFEIEKNRYLDVYKKQKKENPDKLAEEKAAEIVRLTMPTYSLVPKLVKGIRRVPLVGTFVSFPSEVIRTTGNTIQLAYEEIKNQDTRSIGIKRLSGILTASLITGSGAMLSRYILGIDNQDDKDLRRFIAPWSKNSDIIVLSDKGKGVYTYIDVGFSDPYNYLKKPITELMKGGKYEDKAWESIKELVEPFLGEELLASRLVDISRNTKKEGGGKVFNEEAALGDQMSEKWNYLWQGVQPGVIATGKRIAKSFKKDVNDYGGGLTPANEISNLFLGLRTSDIDVEKSFGFKIYKTGDRIYQALEIYKSAKRNKNISEKELQSKKEKAEKALEKIFKDINEDYKAALRLGVKKRQLNKSISNLKIGTYPANNKVKIYIRTGNFKGLYPNGNIK